MDIFHEISGYLKIKMKKNFIIKGYFKTKVGIFKKLDIEEN